MQGGFFLLIVLLLLFPTSKCSLASISLFLLPFLNVYAFSPRDSSRVLTLYFLPPRIPSSSLPQLHLIHSSAAAVIWSAPWLTSSHHICSFLIKYKIAFHNCHSHCCSFCVSICYSNQIPFAPYVSNSSFCTTILLLHLYPNILLSWNLF